MKKYIYGVNIESAYLTLAQEEAVESLVYHAEEEYGIKTPRDMDAQVPGSPEEAVAIFSDIPGVKSLVMSNYQNISKDAPWGSMYLLSQIMPTYKNLDKRIEQFGIDRPDTLGVMFAFEQTVIEELMEVMFGEQKFVSERDEE